MNPLDGNDKVPIINGVMTRVAQQPVHAASICIWYVIALVFTLLAGSSQGQTPVVPAGAGTSGDPYQISNVFNLVWIGDNVASSSGTYYMVQNDIDASDTTNWNGGAGFVPIGNLSTAFGGIFNGNGKEIRDLSICRPDEIAPVGLFGDIGSNSVVSDLRLTSGRVKGGNCVGSLFGRNRGTVSWCYASGAVSGSNSVGVIGGVHISGTMRWCRADGSATGAGTAVGGLVGQVATSNAIVSNCSATATVTGISDVGGLAGMNVGTARACHATGGVTGANLVGGLIGFHINGSVDECYATGNVTGSLYYVGGLVGANGYSGIVTRCYSSGVVTGLLRCGGLAGYVYYGATVSNCYATGRTEGNSEVGGLVGADFQGKTVDAYWDTNTSGQATSAGGIGTNTAAMKQQATFAGWDFTNVWYISENATYPLLRWSLEGQFTYVTNNGTITITGYIGSGGDVVMPDRLGGLLVTSVGFMAYYNCSSLTSIAFPDSLVDIGESAFGGCSSLTSVIIPKNVTNIGLVAFAVCASLTSISVDELNPAYSGTNGVLFDKNQTLIIEYPAGKSDSYYVIPSTVATIGPCAFAYCTNLTNITVSDIVTSIGFGAFDGCWNLASIRIPDGISNIEGWTFKRCSSLTSVTIPAAVTNIGNLAFDSCASLAGVYFQGHAPTHGSSPFSSPFSGDTNTIYYLPTSTGWGSAFGGRPTMHPQIESTADCGVWSSNQFGFNITCSNDVTVLVAATTNLASASWSTAGTNALSGGTSYFSDTQWTNYTSRFYLLRWP